MSQLFIEDPNPLRSSEQYAERAIKARGSQSVQHAEQLFKSLAFPDSEDDENDYYLFDGPHRAAQYDDHDPVAMTPLLDQLQAEMQNINIDTGFECKMLLPNLGEVVFTLEEEPDGTLVSLAFQDEKALEIATKHQDYLVEKFSAVFDKTINLQLSLTEEEQ